VKGIYEAFECLKSCNFRNEILGYSVNWKIGTENFFRMGNPRKGALINKCDILQQSSSLYVEAELPLRCRFRFSSQQQAIF
jgi:hypothetical protein